MRKKKKKDWVQNFMVILFWKPVTLQKQTHNLSADGWVVPAT